MIREELEQIYYLHRELRMWEQELERLRCRSLVRSPQPTPEAVPERPTRSGSLPKGALTLSAA